MKKFEQAKRLYKTMIDEYSVHSNTKVFISGITSDFDRLFELCWKSLKEYLLKEKFIMAARTGSPKDILKISYQQGLIHDEDFWLKLLADRNDDAHHYNESAARAYAARIERDYLGKIGEFITSLSDYIPEEKDVLIDVPEDFLVALEDSGLYYDEFIAKVMSENNCASDLEVFKIWKKIKDKYYKGEHI